MEADDLHQSLSIIFLLPPFAPQATDPTEPFSVNSLIRKTLTLVVPLHFGGKKYFIDFFPPQQSKSGGAARGSARD